MEWIGELERSFATNLYPLRLPIAIGLLLAFVGLVLVARRRGWFAAARRHPARATTLVVLLLAIGIPTGWYLGSPLFIRTSLVEADPGATPAATAPSVGAAPSNPIAPNVTPAPAVAATPVVPLARERSGTFAGADDFHFGKGTARLIETVPGTWVVRFEKFSVRNGPNLYVYLSPDPDGYGDGVVELGALKATDGAFNYEVPAGTDAAAIRSVVVWCKQFSVLFAHAQLSAAS
ncbi:MAG TPA: DM13 domain-containing protein [Candidatus Limnocylindria bacterium]|nr:DM13 domain-containing protein [Candidatus Limnocylindria bacterium]